VTLSQRFDALRSPLRSLESVLTPHGLDRYLELVHPMLVLRDLRAVVTAVERSPASVVLTLRPTRRWLGFTAGQHVAVTVDVDGVNHTRHYSPCSSEHRPDRRFELTVKAHSHGLVSRYLYEQARPGLVVGLRPADGEFVLPSPRPPRCLLISGGSGITPVLSMLRTLVDEGHRGEVVFLHYARDARDVAHVRALQAIAAAHGNVRIVLNYTRQPPGRHFDEAQLAEVAPWYAAAPAFLCGPPALQAAVAAHYETQGIDSLLHVEQFTLLPHMPDPDATGEVRFGDTLITNSGATLLEQAEAAGLRPDYGCRMGICFTCPKRKRAGRTRDIRTGEVHDQADTDVQLCVSVPVGDVVMDF
jgi:ferredoxin-NADP reductase